MDHRAEVMALFATLKNIKSMMQDCSASQLREYRELSLAWQARVLDANNEADKKTCPRDLTNDNQTGSTNREFEDKDLHDGEASWVSDVEGDPNLKPKPAKNGVAKLPKLGKNARRWEREAKVARGETVINPEAAPRKL